VQISKALVAVHGRFHGFDFHLRSNLGDLIPYNSVRRILRSKMKIEAFYKVLPPSVGNSPQQELDQVIGLPPFGAEEIFPNLLKRGWPSPASATETGHSVNSALKKLRPYGLGNALDCISIRIESHTVTIARRPSAPHLQVESIPQRIAKLTVDGPAL
jgi:hypothetical protein